MRRLHLVLPLLPFAVAGCMSRDDARTVFGDGPPDELPALRDTTQLPFHYPAELFARKVEANVTLRLYIDSLGAVRPESTLVAESSGHAALDSAAVSGARILRFTPARRGGQPVGVAVKFPVHFRHPEGSGAADSAGPEAGQRE